MGILGGVAMFTPKMLKSQQFFLSGKTAADAFEAERKAAGIESDLPSPRLLPDYTRKTTTL